MKCKEDFLIKNYNLTYILEIEKQYRRKKNKGRDETMKALKEYQKKNPGAKYTDFLLSLGDFKENKR